MTTAGNVAVALPDLFASFTSTVFRLEAKQQFLVPQEEEALQAFLRGEPRDERSLRTHDWMRQIATSTMAGRHWQRVRLIRHPLTNYTRFELFGLLGNAACGDDTRFAVLNEHPELEALEHQDFWMFDWNEPTTAAVGLMRYDAEGHFLGADVSQDPDVIDRCKRMRELALTHAIGPHAYLMRYRPVWAPDPDGQLRPGRA
jgi:Family of unknown function (DUF6879)